MNNFNNNAGMPYNGNFNQPVYNDNHYNNNRQNMPNFQNQGVNPNHCYSNSVNPQINNRNMTYNPAFNQQRQYSSPVNNHSGVNMYNSEQIKKEIKKADEKKSIKSSANKSAGGLLIFVGITEILITAFIMLISFTGAYDLDNSDYISGIEPVTMYIINAIICLIGFGASAIIITKLNRLRLDDVLKIKKVNAVDTVKFTVASMGFVYVFNLLLMLMNINLNLFGYENESPDYGEINGLWGNIIYFIAIAVVPPIIEEFIFRGAILGSLRKHGDAWLLLYLLYSLDLCTVTLCKLLLHS